MKRGIVLLFLLVVVSVFAVDRKSKETLFGDKYFEVEDYYLAAEYYSVALTKEPTNTYIKYQLAECERYFSAYDKAEVMYNKVMQQDEVNYPLSRFYYAYMQKVNGKYEDAETNFTLFLEKQKETPTVDQAYLDLAKMHFKGCVMALEELQKPYRDYAFELLDAPVNSEESDFAASIYFNDSMIVMSSSRFNEKHAEVDGRLGGAYLDNYVYVKGEEDWEKSSFSSPLEALNTKFHEGASVFSKDRNKFYFTRCDEPLKHNAGYNCAIYVSERDFEGWTEAVKLNNNVNMPGEYSAQPALSEGEDTLFFVSKRPGGVGMNDIWYSVREYGGESWGEAKNLTVVNTPFVEVSPSYYAEDGVLLFASNGHESFGGLDIFIARGEKLDQIENIGLPFNSNKDDFFMSLGENKGYLTSNRDFGIGHDDIFRFDIHYRLSLLATIDADSIPNAEMIDILGKIGRGKRSSVAGLRVFILDEDGELVVETTTDSEGNFTFEGLPAEGVYSVYLDEKGSITREADYTLDNIQVVPHSNSALDGFEDDTKAISISGKLQDKEGNPIVGAEVVLLDADTDEQLKTTTTNEDGEFVFSNLDPSKKYKVMVRDENGDLVEFDYRNKEVQVIEHKGEVNTSSLDLAKSGEVSRVHFESIYFDFDADKLRAESKKVLTELIDFVKPHGHLKIEINGNTDAIGSEEYNLVLGKKRGQNAYDFLVSNGLDKSDIVVNSVGEKNPVAENSTEKGRQLNRRVEFFIVGGGKYEPTAKVYVLEKRTSLSDVAAKFHTSVEEIKKLNGIENESELAAHRPLRIRNTGDSDLNNTNVFEVDNTKTEVVAVTPKTEINGVVYGKDDGSGYYVVLPKNTLYSLSKKFETSVDQLKAWNNLKSNTIIIGQLLRVKEEVKPVNASTDDNTALADAGISIKEHLGEVVLIGGKKRYVVQHGDTFYSISKKFGIGMKKLQALNKKEDYLLFTGMVLKVEE